MYQVLMVEDDPDDAKALEAALARFGEEQGVRFAVTWAPSIIAIDEDVAYDLIFMDIELPGINGLDAAIELRNRNQATSLIFVTNLAQYAVRGYEAEALDFIVKPITYGSFALRMTRALRVMRREARRAITVRAHDGMRVVAVTDLMFAEVEGHNIRYHLADGTSFLARESLTHAEGVLGGSPFLRISSGVIINMAFVRGAHDVEVTLEGGQTLWISRANKHRCLETISRYLGGGA